MPTRAIYERATGFNRGLLTQGLGTRRMHATVPIVFEKHATYHGRAFLPIIIKHSFSKMTNTLRLSVIYMDVTEITEKKHGWILGM